MEVNKEVLIHPQDVMKVVDKIIDAMRDESMKLSKCHHTQLFLAKEAIRYLHESFPEMLQKIGITEVGRSEVRVQ